jgi:hypothetical protein
MNDEIEKLEVLAAQFNEHLPLSDLAKWYNEWSVAAQPATIVAIIDRLKKTEATNTQLREAIDLLAQEHNRAQSEAEKAEAALAAMRVKFIHPSNQQIIQRAGEIFGFKPHEQDEVTKARYLDFFAWAISGK